MFLLPFLVFHFIAFIHTNYRLEMKIKECESRLELEQATRQRLEVQFSRYKDSLEKAQQEASQMKAKEISAQEALKKTQKTLR